MRENDITNKRTTPLRNSNSANKPFRSPLSTVLTPQNNEITKKALGQSPLAKSATPKRSIPQFQRSLKRRRIENDTNDDLTQNYLPSVPSRCELSTIERRIYNKRQEFDNLKTKLNYIKKHKSEDLTAQIDKWRSACKEALFRFRDDIRDKTSEGSSMRQILKMLCIPEKTVKFMLKECDFD